MILNALSRSFSKRVQNQKVSWHWGAGDRAWLNQGKPERRPQEANLLKNPGRSEPRPVLSVENIEVSADKNYMYCQGRISSRGFRSGSNVVVVVEWLDEDKKAVNTDWKRIKMEPAGQETLVLPNILQTFIVKAPLDRRVKWVKAYAFSGTK